MVKNLPARQEIWVPSLGQEDPLEKGMITHSSILAWRIPWTQKSESDMTERLTHTHTHTHIHTHTHSHSGQYSQARLISAEKKTIVNRTIWLILKFNFSYSISSWVFPLQESHYYIIRFINYSTNIAKVIVQDKVGN